MTEAKSDAPKIPRPDIPPSDDKAEIPQRKPPKADWS